MAHLTDYIDEFLAKAKTPQDVHEGITKAFEKVEKEWHDKCKSAFEMGFPKAATVGAWALVWVIKGNKLYVAQAGDSEAVLIKKNADNKFESVKVCKAYSANDAEEQKRLKAEFPKEKDVIHCRSKTACYVKGSLMPTRSFGDFRLKDKDFNFHYKRPEFGFRPPLKVHNGPYISYKPDIREFDLTQEDTYLILASDGVWDEMSVEEVPELISKSHSKILISSLIWNNCCV